MKYMARDDLYMWDVYLLSGKNDDMDIGLHVKQGLGGFGITIREEGTWMKNLIEANYEELNTKDQTRFKEWIFYSIFRGVEEITFK